MPTRVLAIGLDAAEATLIERWAASGDLPTFRRLIDTGAVCRMDNPLETLPGAIWPELNSGASCGRRPLYYHPAQLHSGETRPRPVSPDDLDPGDDYWARASAAGRRVAAIDLPQTVPAPDLNGVQLFEWGLHDRNFAISSQPPALLDEILDRYGDHPIPGCDVHGETAAGYRRLRDGLLTGVGRKTELLLDLLGREHWDLFTCAFGETHCVGHQFWHFLAAAAAGEQVPEDFADAIATVYGRIDEGIGRLLAAAGPDAVALIYTSHGMGPYIGGYQLLPEVLIRLGMGAIDPARPVIAHRVRRWHALAARLPAAWRPVIRRLGRTPALRRIKTVAGIELDPLSSPKVRAVALKNNRCGAIRLNLRGREPFGGVEPGAEAAALIDELRRELAALRDPGTGHPIVDHTVTADEAFGPDHHVDVPDLMVVFRTDLGRIEACQSERVGTVRTPLYHPNIPRTGDHTVESRLWAVGPRIPAGRRLPDANVLDLAPTILRLLDVPLGERLDGRPIAAVAPAPLTVSTV